jgi:glutathione S-transferase
MRTVERALIDGRPYLSGDRFSAADLLLSTCINWAIRYGVPVADEIVHYNNGITGRQAYARAVESNKPPTGAT